MNNNSYEVSTNDKLVRLVLANLLWQDQFYVDGQTTAEIIATEVAKADPEFVSKLAIAARTNFKLRHIPLLLLRELAKTCSLKASSLADAIQRPDELSKFLDLYWQDGKQPLSKQVKLGLGQALKKFSAFQLAKWDLNSANQSIKDIMFLTHPKPDTVEQSNLFRMIANEKLPVPKTWEVLLSQGGCKSKVFTELMESKQLGALAFLRNLRNMVKSGVSEQLIRSYAEQVDCERVLPFRFISAARSVPQLEAMLEQMMFKSLQQHKKLQGKTLLMVDVSGSMFGMPISSKSDLNRFDAAAALAILCREVCDSVDIYSFSDSAVQVAPRRGFALVDAINHSQLHMGTMLNKSLQQVTGKYDRVIVFTDEQSYDVVEKPTHSDRCYSVNVAAYTHGVSNAEWTTISGFSESILDFIIACEEPGQLL